MINRRWALVALAISCALAACSPVESTAPGNASDGAANPLTPQVRTFNHSPTKAAQIAEEHLRLMLVEQDWAGGYELLAAETREILSVTELEQGYTKISGVGLVTSIEATHYQPVPGTEYVDIFLVGEGGEVPYYYSARMQGSTESGYLVSDIWEMDGPPEDSAMLSPLP